MGFVSDKLRDFFVKIEKRSLTYGKHVESACFSGNRHVFRLCMDGSCELKINLLETIFAPVTELHII